MLNVDEPANATCLLATVQPEALGTAMRLRAMAKADAGFVTWDSVPPLNDTWSNHRRSFMNAIYVGLAFCRTDTRFEWCVLGSDVFAFVRGLPDFHQAEAVVTDPLVFVGKLGSVSVYVPAAKVVTVGVASTSDRCVGLPGNRFFVGVDERCACGAVNNCPSFTSTPAYLTR